MSGTICNHTGGHDVAAGIGAPSGSASASACKGISVSTPGGTSRMAALSAAPKKRFNPEKHVDAAERAGATLGNRLVTELLALRDRNQGEVMQALQAKLLALRNLEHFDRAAGGFAVALVSVLEVGIANLPKMEDCE